MLKSILEYNKFLRIGIRLVHPKSELQVVTKPEMVKHDSIKYELMDEEHQDDIIEKITKRKQSVLETCKEDLSHIAPYLKPTFNFASYVNKSETLQELLKLGVNLNKLEKVNDAPEYIIGLNFEQDVKEHVMFLYSLGLSVDEIGEFITKNPFIFKQSLDDLTTRINYLKYKKFNDEMILRIVGDNPLWLQFSTQDIDARLGFLQQHFGLKGDEVRALSVKKPKIVTYDLSHIKLNSFVVKEEMGFSSKETKTILLEQPGIFMKNQKNLLKTFEYLHKTMMIPLEEIAKSPKILTCREHRLRERYLFLKKLNRFQFDPKKPNYVSLITLVTGPDSDFATEIAKSSIQTYNDFLKTL